MTVNVSVYTTFALCTLVNVNARSVNIMLHKQLHMYMTYIPLIFSCSDFGTRILDDYKLELFFKDHSSFIFIISFFNRNALGKCMLAHVLTLSRLAD